jgi:hypothetical protein
MRALAALLFWLAALPALAQGTGVNPVPGSIWTYLGATYGAGWVPNNQIATCVAADAIGLVGDGHTDNKLPWNNYIAGQGGNGVCISLRTGQTYYFSAAPATTALGAQQAFYLYGNGARLLFHNSNGLSFQYTGSAGYGFGGPRMLISDTEFVTDATGFTGLAVNGNIQSTQLVAPTYLVRNHYYGTNQTGGGTGNYWGIARGFTDTSNILVDGESVVGRVAAFVGIGLDVQGSDPALTPSVVNVSNEQDFWLQIGINVHGYFQGLNVGRGSNFTGLQYGVICNAPVGEYQCDVHDSQFSVTTNAIQINNWVDNIIQGNDIGGGVYNGTPTGTPGLIALSGNASNTTISANHIEAYNGGNGNWNSCVTLTGAQTGNPPGVTVMGNRRDTGGGGISGLADPFIVADSSGMWISGGNNIDGDIAWNGHVSTRDIAVAPTLACGASAYLESGSDADGTIVMQTASTSCQLTFARAHLNYNSCVVTPHSSSGLPHFQFVQTLSGFTASWPGDGSATPTIGFICFGN